MHFHLLTHSLRPPHTPPHLTYLIPRTLPRPRGRTSSKFPHFTQSTGLTPLTSFFPPSCVLYPLCFLKQFFPRAPVQRVLPKHCHISDLHFLHLRSSFLFYLKPSREPREVFRMRPSRTKRASRVKNSILCFAILLPQDAPLSHETRVEYQKLMVFCDFECPGATICGETRVKCQKLDDFLRCSMSAEAW